MTYRSKLMLTVAALMLVSVPALAQQVYVHRPFGYHGPTTITGPNGSVTFPLGVDGPGYYSENNLRPPPDRRYWNGLDVGPPVPGLDR